MKNSNLDIRHGSASQKRGAKGEGRAVLYLLLRGYRILERNYLYGRKEVDIIAKKGDTIAFIEVKARYANDLAPRLAVTASKRRNIVSAAKAYAAQNGIHNAYLRFDIIEVDLQKRLPLAGVTHIPGAFTE